MRISDWSSDVCSSDLLTNEADAAPSGPLADVVRRQTTVMRRHVDHYLSRARAAASGQVLGARTEVMPVIEDLCRALARLHEIARASCRERVGQYGLISVVPVSLTKKIITQKTN